MPDACKHDWVFIKDWYGNDEVPNGTADCSYYRCQLCGTEQEEMPEGYEPPFQEPYED